MDCREVGSQENERSSPNLCLDRLLRFNGWVSERYEDERGAERVMLLRHLTYVGLLLYNAYNLTAIFLMPDILGMAVSLRVLIVTPASLLLSWIIGHIRSEVREWVVAIGMINAFAGPALLFWLTDAPLGGYVFAELTLILVYGNMLLLRFQQAVVFTTVAFALATIAVLTKAGLPDSLKAAFVLQMATACIWTLYANYRSEVVRCRSYGL